jgi:uncharacterized YccA/Bax inhibitor family protein
MRTANPILTADAFRKPQTWSDFERSQRGEPARAAARPGTMTVAGTVNATLVLLGLTIAASFGGWFMVARDPSLVHPIWITGALGGLAIGFFLRFAPRAAVVAAPFYALFEGAFLGAFSFVFAKWLGPAVIFQALVLTFGILLALLLSYRAGFIRVGGLAQRMIVAATGGIMFVYLAVFVLHLLGVQQIPYIHSLVRIEGAGWLGIGFTALCVVLASLNLVLDFQFVEAGAKAGLPRHMEWYAAFGLLVTLVWLYVELVRLLAKLRSSNN